MIDPRPFISSLIEDTPSRAFGTKGEDVASQTIADHFYNLGLRTDIDGFSCPGSGNVTFMAYLFLLFLAALIAFFAPGLKLLALILSIIGLVLLYMSLAGKDPISPFLYKVDSQNVVARYTPDELRGKSRKRKVVFLAYYDVPHASFAAMPAFSSYYATLKRVFTYCLIAIPLLLIAGMFPLPEIAIQVISIVCLVLGAIAALGAVTSLASSFLKAPKGANNNAAAISVMYALAHKLTNADIREGDGPFDDELWEKENTQIRAEEGFDHSERSGYVSPIRKGRKKAAPKSGDRASIAQEEDSRDNALENQTDTFDEIGAKNAEVPKQDASNMTTILDGEVLEGGRAGGLESGTLSADSLKEALPSVLNDSQKLTRIDGFPIADGLEDPDLTLRRPDLQGRISNVRTKARIEEAPKEELNTEDEAIEEDAPNGDTRIFRRKDADFHPETSDAAKDILGTAADSIKEVAEVAEEKKLPAWWVKVEEEMDKVKPDRAAEPSDDSKYRSKFADNPVYTDERDSLEETFEAYEGNNTEEPESEEDVEVEAEGADGADGAGSADGAREVEAEADADKTQMFKMEPLTQDNIDENLAAAALFENFLEEPEQKEGENAQDGSGQAKNAQSENAQYAEPAAPQDVSSQEPKLSELPKKASISDLAKSVSTGEDFSEKTSQVDYSSLGNDEGAQEKISSDESDEGMMRSNLDEGATPVANIDSAAPAEDVAAVEAEDTSTAEAEEEAQEARKALLNLPVVGATQTSSTGSMSAIQGSAHSQKGLDTSVDAFNDSTLLRSNATGEFAANLTGSFAPLSASGVLDPVTIEQLQDYHGEEESIYIEDADDSSVESHYSEDGSYAISNVDMPTNSRVRKLFGGFGKRKKKDDFDVSANEWLGVDADYDARKEGGSIGNWENFDDFPDDDDAYRGGAVGGTREQNKRALSVLTDDLLNKEVWFIALGASDGGGAGIKNLLDTRAGDLKYSTFVNLDGIGAGELFATAEEGFLFSKKTDIRLHKLISKSAESAELDMDLINLDWRSTQATEVLARGARAISIVGLDGTKTLGRRWSNDVFDIVEDSNLRNVYKLLIEIVKNV